MTSINNVRFNTIENTKSNREIIKNNIKETNQRLISVDSLHRVGNVERGVIKAVVDDRFKSLFTGKNDAGLPSTMFASDNKNISDLKRIAHFSSEYQKGLNQSLTISHAGNELLERLSNNSDIPASKIKQIKELINKFSSGTFTNENIKELNSFLQEGLKNKSFEGIASTQDIEALSSLLTRMDNADKKVQLTKGDFYLKSIEDVKTTTNALIKSLSSSNVKNNFSVSVKTLLGDYEKILSTGNPASIAIYKKMMENLLSAVQNGASGQELADIVQKYNNIKTSIESGKLNSEIKTDLKAYLGEQIYNDLGKALMDYYKGDKSSPTEINNTEIITENNPKPLEVNQVKTETGSIEKTANNTQDKDGWDLYLDAQKAKPELPSYNKEFMTKLASVTKTEIKEVFDKVPQFKSNLENWFKSGEQFNTKLHNFAEALREKEKIIEEFNNKLEQVFNNMLTNIDNYQVINEVVKLAEILEQKLDLKVDSKDASIAPLLEKFREIITKCDLDMKTIIKQMLEKNTISESFTRNQRDMQYRWEKLDIAKAELLKIFNEAEENKRVIK